MLPAILIRHTYRSATLTASLCAQLFAASVQAQTVTDPSLLVEPVITSGGLLAFPTSMAFIAPDDILIGEKDTGLVRRITSGTLQAGSVLDLPVGNDSEQGLLGMALDPLFATNSLVYLFYTRAATDGANDIDQRISRFTWTGTALINEQVVVTLPSTPGANHDGGIIVFGPPNVAAASQKLFAVIGDLNRQNQTENFATGAVADDTASVIRINPDGSTPAGTEKGPFFDVAAGNVSLERLYAYGIRNCFGLDFDPQSSELWDTENGPGSYDEINLVGSASNSGWKRFMGLSTAPGSIPGGSSPGLVQLNGVGTYSEPEFSWRQIVAPTSIHFLRSSSLGSQYQFDCFVGVNNNSNLYRFKPNPARTGFTLTGGLADTVLDTTAGDNSNDPQIVFGSGFVVVTDIETGPDGFMYVVSLVNGQIYRIRPTVTAVDDWQVYE